MAIYDRPVRLLMREMIDQLAPNAGAVITRQDALNWFAQHYPKVKDGTVSAHLLRFSTNSKSRHHYSPRPDEAQLFQLDGGRFRRYDPTTDPPPLDSQATSDPADFVDDDGSAEPSQFAYESDLRDFLARNLTIIEPGLQLYEDEGIRGVEFPVGGRFADILAVDAKRRLVVIELKVSRGYDRVVGQLLRYMAWISQHQAEEGQGVRGMIIAREISNDLRLACSNVPDVELFEYELAVTIRGVPLWATAPPTTVLPKRSALSNGAMSAVSLWTAASFGPGARNHGCRAMSAEQIRQCLLKVDDSDPIGLRSDEGADRRG